MVMLNGFDANTTEPTKSFDPVPTGKYVAIIENSEEKPNAKGTGTYLQLTLQIVDGEQKGRKLWARLNLNNPNQQAVQIAMADLSAICRAVKVMTPRDSAELHGKPLIITVVCKKRSDTGDISNEIKGYESVGQAAAPGAPPVTGMPQAQGTPPGTAPWTRK